LRTSVLLLLENQFPILRADFDPVARLEFAFEQAQGKRVEHLFLNGAFERARAELRVVAFPGVRYSTTSRRAFTAWLLTPCRRFIAN
jgi:hypothetical protein